MKRYATLILILIALLSASCTRPKVAYLSADPELAVIDGLMWTQPDSAFAQLQAFAESHEVDSLNDFNGHYFHLLLSELLYKNYCEQSNRNELLRAVDYYDSLVAEGGSRVDADMVFLDARSHYIYGVGYYEMDSAVPACCEYLQAVELMEECFNGKELTGKRAKFMALAFTHLTVVFSDQYLHEQAIFFGKSSLPYYSCYDTASWQVSWVLETIGSHYEMLEQLDSASWYYDRAASCLNDTTGLVFRDITTHQAYLSYKTGQDTIYTLKRLREMLSMSESQGEYYARCLAIGDVFCQEQQYDSAWLFLNRVYRESESTDARRQAVEWLVKISKLRGLCSDEYADYLVPFANLDASQSEAKTLLAEQYSTFLRRDHDNEHRREIIHQKRKTSIIIGIAVFLFLAYFVFYHVVKHKKKLSETEFSKEKYAHNMAQKALMGKLKKKDEKLRLSTEENKKLLEKLDAQQKKQTWSSYDDFINEPICQTILGMFKDVHIKREANINEYKNLQLDGDQLSQLEVAVSKHFKGLGKMLTSLCPKITRNEMYQCLLSLLNLEDVQIAALLQYDYSTIKKRSVKLRKAFLTEKTLQSFMRGWVL